MKALSSNIRAVSIDRIVGLSEYPIVQSNLKSLTKAIARDGLQQPVDVQRGIGFAKNKFVLVDGHHRVAAIKVLGFPTVQIRILGSTESETRRHSANVHRRVPSALERSESIVAQSLYHQRPTNFPGGRQPHDKCISRIARDLGYSRRIVSDAFKHAALSEEIKNAIRGQPTSFNRSQLTKLAGMTIEEQRAFVGLSNKASNLTPLPKKNLSHWEKCERSWSHCQFSKLFKKLSKPERMRFVEQVIGIKSGDPPIRDSDWV